LYVLKTERLLRLTGLAVVFLLLGATAEPPQIEEPETSERTFTIKGNGLTIENSPETAYLRFSDGVSMSSPDLVLTADVVELDIFSQQITSGEQLKFPEQAPPSTRATRDPSETAAEMVRELKVPDAQFKASAIQRVGAVGNVQVSGSGITLSVPELVSTDGGQTWITGARGIVTGTEQESGAVYQLAADYIVYDTASTQALAQGNITGEFNVADQPALQVAAQRCELDVSSSELRVSEGLSMQYGSSALRCETLHVNLTTQQLRAEGDPLITDEEQGLTLSAQALMLWLVTRRMEASKNVYLTLAPGAWLVPQSRFAITLTAEQLTVILEEQEAADSEDTHWELKECSARGGTELTYGLSSTRGESITLRNQDDRIVIEIEGPQQSSLNLDELETLMSASAPDEPAE